MKGLFSPALQDLHGLCKTRQSTQMERGFLGYQLDPACLPLTERIRSIVTAALPAFSPLLDFDCGSLTSRRQGRFGGSKVLFPALGRQIRLCPDTHYRGIFRG